MLADGAYFSGTHWYNRKKDETIYRYDLLSKETTIFEKNVHSMMFTQDCRYWWDENQGYSQPWTSKTKSSINYQYLGGQVTKEAFPALINGKRHIIFGKNEIPVPNGVNYLTRIKKGQIAWTSIHPFSNDKLNIWSSPKEHSIKSFGKISGMCSVNGVLCIANSTDNTIEVGTKHISLSKGLPWVLKGYKNTLLLGTSNGWVQRWDPVTKQLISETQMSKGTIWQCHTFEKEITALSGSPHKCMIITKSENKIKKLQ